MGIGGHLALQLNQAQLGEVAAAAQGAAGAALVPENVDGVLLGLHGSGVVEPAIDLEGALLAAVRRHIGPDLPLVATLDLHAHVSEAMVHNADALVAWETYPTTTSCSKKQHLFSDKWMNHQEFDYA